jgi:hypothetical protein
LSSKYQKKAQPLMLDTTVVVISLATYDSHPIYILVDRATPDAILQVEATVAATSRYLANVGLCTYQNIVDALRKEGLTVVASVTLTRAWDVYPGSVLDTWTVRIPKDAPHSLAGITMMADPLPGLEHNACALRCEGTQEVYLPNDQPYRYIERARENLMIQNSPNEEVYEQVPLGPIELPLAQFGGLESAARRAENLMKEAGFVVLVVPT